MAKSKLHTAAPLHYGYLDGKGQNVVVVYAEGEPIDEELFDEASLDQLKKSGQLKTKKELKAAETDATAETAPPPPAPVADKKPKK